MATKYWVGGVATWETGSGWSPPGQPGPGDDVVIGGQPGTSSVTLSDDTAVNSLVLTGVGTLLQFSGSSLTATNGITLNQGTTLQVASSSSLLNTTLTLAGGTVQGAVLDGVVVRGTLDAAQYGTLRVADRVTLAPPAGQAGLLLTGAGAALFAFNAATLDGGIILAGSAQSGNAASLNATSRSLQLGPAATLDVIGALIIAQGSQGGGGFTNQGVINIAPGGSLSAPVAFAGSGTLRVLGGTLQTQVLAGPAAFDDGTGTIRLTGLLGPSAVPTALTGFRSGDTLDLTGLAWGGDVTAAMQGGVLQVSKGNTVQAAYRLTDAQPGQVVTVQQDAGFGTLVTTTAQPLAPLAFTDQTLGDSGSHSMDPIAAGAPSYLQWQYIDTGGDTVAMAAAVPNVFIHAGSGTKAITVTSGQNVVDGGTGSAFLTSGSGADTFFVDVRGGGTVWDTLSNFHAGDAITVWGYQAPTGTMLWDGVYGAAGHQGATLRLSLAGNGTTNASVSFDGISPDRAAGLQTSTGTVGGLAYLYIYNPGV